MSEKNKKMALKIDMSKRHSDLLGKERNKHNISVQMRRRINIILLAFSGQNNSFIAKKLGTTPKTVRDWRNRWAANYAKLQLFEKGKDGQGVSDLELLRYILGFLKDAPRKGAPKTFTAAQEQQIVALACEKPIQHGVQMTDWTHEMLAKTAIAKSIVPSISSSQVGRILKNKPTPTAEIRILAVSQNR